MSKVFYDNLVSLKKLEKEINHMVDSVDEKEELWNLVDELIHQRVINSILEKLAPDHHEEFVVRLHNAPHDEALIDYLVEKMAIDVHEFLRVEVLNIGDEILSDIKGTIKKKK